jgi:hypothetical protein
MADHPDHPAVPLPLNLLAAATGTPSKQTSPVKKVTNWFRNKNSSKNKQGLKSLKKPAHAIYCPRWFQD